MTHTTQTTQQTYQSPKVEVVEVYVENGYAFSMEDPDENDEIDW